MPPRGAATGSPGGDPNHPIWFTDEAIAAWAAEARTTRGGQCRYSPLAILTALTIRAVFRLAYRQAEGLIGSIVSLLGLSLGVPDHTTLSRRAATLDVPPPANAGVDVGSEPMHLLVDSTGLKLCGKGEWLLEKHGTATRRSWRMLHLGVDAGTGRIVAATLTSKDVDDASQAGPLLDQVAGPVASFTGDGGYDRDRVYASVAQRHPEAAVVVPPRANAVPSDTAETSATQRDGHLQHIAEHGRVAWQNASGYNKRARIEATIGRWKQVIGDELRAHTDERRATEVAVAVHASVVQGSGDGSEALGDVRDRPPQLRMPILPFKLNQDRRCHIPRQRHRVTNSLGALLRSRPTYDASLRQRGSLTV